MSSAILLSRGSTRWNPQETSSGSVPRTALKYEAASIAGAFLFTRCRAQWLVVIVNLERFQEWMVNDKWIRIVRFIVNSKQYTPDVLVESASGVDAYRLLAPGRG